MAALADQHQAQRPALLAEACTLPGWRGCCTAALLARHPLGLAPPVALGQAGPNPIASDLALRPARRSVERAPRSSAHIASTSPANHAGARGTSWATEKVNFVLQRNSRIAHASGAAALTRDTLKTRRKQKSLQGSQPTSLITLVLSICKRLVWLWLWHCSGPSPDHKTARVRRGHHACKQGQLQGYCDSRKVLARVQEAPLFIAPAGVHLAQPHVVAATPGEHLLCAAGTPKAQQSCSARNPAGLGPRALPNTLPALAACPEQGGRPARCILQVFHLKFIRLIDSVNGWGLAGTLTPGGGKQYAWRGQTRRLGA